MRRHFFGMIILWIGFAAQAVACELRSMQVGTTVRDGIVCTPGGSAPTPWPVVLAFHGRGGKAIDMALTARFHEKWPEALVIYPNGLTGNPGPNDPQGTATGWQFNPGDLGDRDVAFVDSLVTTLGQRYPIDRGRLHAAGHSNGARFVGVLWSMRGAHISRMAFSAGQADTLMNNAPPRSVFMGMGTTDPVAPFSWQSRSIGMAATLLGIPSDTPNMQPGVQRLVGTSGQELTVLIHSGGHIWPEGQSDLIVDFLKRGGSSSGMR